MTGGCRRAMAAVVLVIAVLTGCTSGSDDGPTSDRASAGEQTTTTTASVPAGTTASLAPVTTGTNVVADELSFFVTPSKNIGCAVSAAEARCDIAEHTWTPPPKPASCEFDWGGSLTVNGTSAHVSCVSDTLVRVTERVLPYGETLRAGAVECASRPDGVTCTHTGTGHGFFIARARYSLF